MSSLARWLFRFALAGGLAAALGYLPYRASGGIGRSLRLRGELAELVESNLKLKQENQLRRQRITRLKHDRRAIERVARDELGLVQANDVVFHFEE